MRGRHKSKLTEAILEALRRHPELSRAQLAAKFGWSIGTVKAVASRHRKDWEPHIPQSPRDESREGYIYPEGEE